MKHPGGCHCGAVRFEIESPAEVTIHVCNCSICSLVGYQHLIVPRDRFSLLVHESSLSLYTFNTHVAKHYFCKICGVKPYYVPRSNPDGISVNFRCVSRELFTKVEFKDFDGQNWEANASSLSHLSAPDQIQQDK